MLKAKRNLPANEKPWHLKATKIMEVSKTVHWGCKRIPINFAVLLAISFLIISCDEGETKATDDKATVVTEKVSQGPITEKGEQYEYENDTIKQSILIHYINENEIRFRYSINMKKKLSKINLNGIATNNYPEGTEIDEDEEGTAYPSNEYVHTTTDGATLAIRISLEGRDKVVINATGYEEVPVPIQGLGILRINRKKKKESENEGRSLSQDRRGKAKTKSKPGQGDKGDR